MNTSLNAPVGDGVLRKTILASDGVLDLWEKVLMWIACVMLVVMMFLVSADAVLRYLFNHPLAFAQDVVVLYLLPASAFFAFSIALRNGVHIAVDAVANTLPQRLFNAILAISLLLSLVFLVVMTRVGAHVAYESWRMSETTGGVYPMPIWPSKIIVPLGLGTLSLRAAHAVIANLYSAFTADRAVAYPKRINQYSDPVAPGAE